MTGTTRRASVMAAVLGPLLALGVLLGLLTGCGTTLADPATAPAATSTATRADVAPKADGTATDPASGLPYVDLAALPPQAARTVTLIERGGPFPYAKDGTVFRNAEGLLPDEPRGFYHEYTVPTPGESDRGARRIVAGRDGALYWTGDHYASFARIRR